MKVKTKSGSWTVVTIMAALVLLTQSFSLFFSINGHPNTDPVLIFIRGTSAFFASMILIFNSYLRSKKMPSLPVYCFLLVVLPLFPIIWFNHATFVKSGLPWIPLAGPKLFFFVLAILVPGPYWVNGLLMGLVAIESTTLWLVLDISHHVGNMATPEPWLTIMFGIICFTLLMFRYRNEQTIRRLSRESARYEFMEILAKVFLGLRDLSNTPLQTLVTSVEILKRRNSELAGIVEPMSDAVERLSRLNSILTRFEGQITWNEAIPLTEQEILEWISKVEIRIEAKEGSFRQ